jgi:hypothetical protein
MNLENRQRVLGLFAGVAFALLVGDHFILTPLLTSWKERSARLVDLRKRVVEGTGLIEREGTLRRRWSDMQTNMLTGETSVAQSQVLKAFYSWVDASGVSVTSIRPEVKQAEDGSLTLECRADAIGTLANLTQFMYLIEKDAMGVKIDALDLTPRDKQANEVNLVLQISGPMLPSPRS